MKPPRFFSELRRRNVFKVAVAYAVVAWLLIQIAIFPYFEIPGGAVRLVVILVLLGFPIALAIAWAFEMTPQGLKRTENVSPDEHLPYWSRRKFVAFNGSLALVAATMLAFQLFGPQRDPAADQRIADNFNRDPEKGNFADGTQNEPLPKFDAAAAQRFADLALACVHQEYPNKISHTLKGDEDVAPPRELTPAFYGCYDWHSSVHGHWLLARLARTFPEAPFAAPARAALKQSLTAGNLEREASYLQAEGRTSFERPYGLAWLLQLIAELREWDDPTAREMLANLRPLEEATIERIGKWLPKLSHPIRIGEHAQTAFALGLMLDYARGSGNKEFENLLTEKARQFYLADKNAPLSYEPGGEDFLSPVLGEADAMRRVLSPAEFAKWLEDFLPQLPTKADTKWLPVAVSPDPSDPKLAHLDGLNLSRAWMLEGIVAGLPPGDARRSALSAATDAHRRAGLAAVTGEHYEGGHWLGSFAVYLTTKRGLSPL